MIIIQVTYVDVQRTKKKRRGIERKKKNALCASVKNPMKNNN